MQDNDQQKNDLLTEDTPAGAPEESLAPVTDNASDKPEESFDEKPEEFNDARPKIYRKHIALQIVLGVFSACAIWGSLWFLRAKEGIFTWIWVILFGVVFIGKSRIERSKNIYFKAFTLAMLFGMIGAIVLTLVGYWIFSPGTLQFFSNPS